MQEPEKGPQDEPRNVSRVSWPVAEWPPLGSDGQNLHVPGFFRTKHLDDMGPVMRLTPDGTPARASDRDTLDHCWRCQRWFVLPDDSLGLCEQCIKRLHDEDLAVEFRVGFQGLNHGMFLPDYVDDARWSDA